MKKQLSKLMKVTFAFLIVTMIASCGAKKPSAEEVNAKIEAGDQLSQADYNTMIEYVGDYATKAQELFNTINAQPNDSTADYVKAANDMAELYGKYPYLNTFRSCLANADASQFDNKNLELINKYCNDQAFPLPVGEGAAMLNPQVQGMIEDMPNTDTGNVIATGDGEAVDINVE